MFVSFLFLSCVLVSFPSWSSLQVSPTLSLSLRIWKLIGWWLKHLCAQQTLLIMSCVLISCAHMWCQSSSPWQCFATFPWCIPSTKYACNYTSWALVAVVFILEFAVLLEHASLMLLALPLKVWRSPRNVFLFERKSDFWLKKETLN